MKVLLLGASGKLGSALQAQLSSTATLTAFSRTDLDIANADAVGQAIASLKPDVVVNAAAYTDVRGAESNKETADLINGTAVGMIGRHAADRNAIVVHISTDFVFDGTGDRPYQEDDSPSPLNAYGASKLLGETVLRESGAPHVIIRTAWLFSAGPDNFVNTMIEKAKSGQQLRVVDDQLGSPTAVPVLAQAVNALLRIPASSLARRSEAGQIFHVACRGEASWYQLAHAALSDAGLDTAGLTPISTAQSGETLARPAYSVLDVTRFEQTFSVRMPHWRAAVRPVARMLARS